eukprot:4636582-Pyramimonas_sp.AAC.2
MSSGTFKFVKGKYWKVKRQGIRTSTRSRLASMAFARASCVLTISLLPGVSTKTLIPHLPRGPRVTGRYNDSEEGAHRLGPRNGP